MVSLRDEPNLSGILHIHELVDRSFQQSRVPAIPAAHDKQDVPHLGAAQASNEEEIVV